MTHNNFITIMDHRCVMTLYMLTIVNVLHSFPVFNLSTCQIQMIRIRSQAECKTVWILISWLLSGTTQFSEFSRTRITGNIFDCIYIFL